MDSKIIIVTFCVLLAASLKSETEAVASHNPDFNGKRSSVLKLSNVRRTIRNMCATMNDVCKMERDELQDADQ